MAGGGNPAYGASSLFNNVSNSRVLLTNNIFGDTSSRNLKVANAAESQTRVLEALRGEPGPAHDIVALNAGTALYAAGVASSIEEGLRKARAAIASGAALAKLDQFVSVTRQLGAAN